MSRRIIRVRQISRAKSLPFFTYFLSNPYKCHGNQAFSLIRITKDPHASSNLDGTRHLPFRLFVKTPVLYKQSPSVLANPRSPSVLKKPYTPFSPRE